MGDISNKFISNIELRKLLVRATLDERLALTKILNENEEKPYAVKLLQEKISKEGGHGVVNYFRGEGTGYLDILDDIADSLEIQDVPSYESTVKYYDEIYYIKNEKYDEPDSSIKRLYNKKEATELGLEYALDIEKKIILTLIKKSYEAMKKQKKDAEDKILQLEKDKSIISLDTKYKFIKVIKIRKRINFQVDLATKDELNIEILKLQNEIKKFIEQKKQLDISIQNTKKDISDIVKKLDDFDGSINEVVKEFDSNNAGTLTGIAGIMSLANLGGFATYTLLTSTMSIVSMGTLGFGAYTAATSLLSIIIGPIGWTGLAMFTLFSFGKPEESKLMLITATIGAIRQRIKFSSKNKNIM